MHVEQVGHPIIGGDPEERIVLVDGAALDEVSGGVPSIIVCPIPLLGIGGIIDGIVTGVKDAVNGDRRSPRSSDED